MRATEVDLDPGVDAQLRVLGQLTALIQVSDRRSCSGRVPIWAVIASRTACAPCPASGGPFLTYGVVPKTSIRGRCSSIVYLLVRSTSLPIADLSNPMIRSPSQWPGTARSCASAGRWEILTSSVTKLRPLRRVRGVARATPARCAYRRSAPA